MKSALLKICSDPPLSRIIPYHHVIRTGSHFVCNFSIYKFINKNNLFLLCFCACCGQKCYSVIIIIRRLQTKLGLILMISMAGKYELVYSIGI